VQRVLSPVLLTVTLVVLGTGLGLAATRRGMYGPLLGVHKLGSIIRGVLVGVHLLAYLPWIPALINADWRHQQTYPARWPGTPRPGQPRRPRRRYRCRDPH
jgi:hypothetical protein